MGRWVIEENPKKVTVHLRLSLILCHPNSNWKERIYSQLKNTRGWSFLKTRKSVLFEGVNI